MTNREKLFCDEYMISGNACAAAKKAGYVGQTAVNASRWLDPNSTKKYKPHLVAYIQEHSEKIHNAKIASAEEIREFFTSVVRSSEEKTQDRLKAGELLAKIQGQFIEKISVEGTIPIVICGEDLLKE